MNKDIYDIQTKGGVMKESTTKIIAGVVTCFTVALVVSVLAYLIVYVLTRTLMLLGAV